VYKNIRFSSWIQSFQYFFFFFHELLDRTKLDFQKDELLKPIWESIQHQVNKVTELDEMFFSARKETYQAALSQFIDNKNPKPLMTTIHSFLKQDLKEFGLKRESKSKGKFYFEEVINGVTEQANIELRLMVFDFFTYAA
jgi:hypothetical protein